MTNNFTASSSMTFSVPTEKVWEALTNPTLVKEWLFGTEMTVSEWAVGGEIRYRGQWEGKSYEDKGTIVELVPGKKLVSTYWSAFSGLPDSPENYQRVSYEVTPEGSGARLVITQEGSKTEDQAKHSEGNWDMVMQSMKKLLER